MQKKRRLRATIPLLVLAAMLAACGRDERARREQVSAAQQALTCLPLDDFTPVLTTNGWRQLTTPSGGSGDITAALQAAVNEIAYPSSGPYRPTIYIPAGSWTIDHTIQMEYGYGVNIVGAGPATTTITWAGAAATGALVAPLSGSYWTEPNTASDMFRIIDVGRMKFSRLTLDGAGTARIGVQVLQSACYTQAAVGGVADKSACNLSATTPGGLSVAVTGLEFNDDVFTNLQYGIVAGSEETYYSDNGTLVLLDSGMGQTVAGRNASHLNQGDVLIRRSRFDTISQQGVNIWGTNAFNWLIAESEFSSCYRGVVVGSHGGAALIGNRFVANGMVPTIGVDPAHSFTMGMDILINGDVSSVVRGNVSLGSRKFLTISANGGVSAGDVSGNYVSTSPPAGLSDPSVPAISTGLTQLTLFDNYIETTQSIAVQTEPPLGSNGIWSDHARITHGGNSFKTTDTTHCNTDCTPVGAAGTCPFLLAANPSSLSGSLAKELDAGDNHCTSSPATPAPAADALATVLTPVAPSASSRTVHDVSQISVTVGGTPTNIGAVCTLYPPTSSCADLINTWLAAQSSTATPLLFFPAADYYLDKPILIPGGLDVVIAGAGGRTTFFWVGTDTAHPDQYLFHVQAPARASLRDFNGFVNRSGTTRPGGILVDSTDDSGGLVFIDTVTTQFAKSAVDVLGLDNVTVRADLTGGGSLERVLGVTGGGKAAPNLGGSSQTKGLVMFAGGGGSQASYINLKSWGKAVLIGVDNEAAPQGMVLDQSGYLTLNNGRFLPSNQAAPYDSYFADQPNVVVQSSFRGRLTLMNLSTHSGFIGQAASREAQVLSLGNWYTATNAPSSLQPLQPASCSGTSHDCSFYNQLGPSGQPGRMALQNGSHCDSGAVHSYCDDDPAPSSAVVTFVNTMLADTRAASSAPPTACSDTAVRIHRVAFQGLTSPNTPSNFMGPGVRVQRF